MYLDFAKGLMPESFIGVCVCVCVYIFGCVVMFDGLPWHQCFFFQFSDVASFLCIDPSKQDLFISNCMLSNMEPNVSEQHHLF
jgi:hypothetical protein